MGNHGFLSQLKSSSTVGLVAGVLVFGGMATLGLCLMYRDFFVYEGVYRFIDGTLALILTFAVALVGLLCFLHLIARWRLRRMLAKMSKNQNTGS